MNLFYSNFSESQDEIVVNENDSKHIIKSYRKNIGDIIKFTNGNGLLAEAKIIYKGKKIKVKILNILKKKREKISIPVSYTHLTLPTRFSV